MLSEPDKTFIQIHLNDKIEDLLFKYHSKKDLNYKFLIQQINGKQKAKKKLPTFSQIDNFIFPPSLNLSQSSSEYTAEYKSNLINGKTGIDLTGGLGVDSIFFSKKFESFIHLEPNKDLQKIANTNFKKVFSDRNIRSLNISCEDFLNQNEKRFDFIYLDPSRRDENNRKTVFLEDYSPNIIELQNNLLKRSKKVMIKTSPVLDITDSLRKLNNCTEVHIVSIKNDVKEVLYLLDNINTDSIKIKCVNIEDISKEIFEFIYHSESNPNYSETLSYIYEPNNSIMKSGGMNHLCESYNIHKLHSNSHLFTSNELINDFPGRKFELNKTLDFKSKELKNFKKANITVRNFPESVDQIRKRTKIKDGGDIYLFATTLINDKPVILVCNKI